MDRASLIIGGYCDGDLSEEERAWLLDWLRADAAHADRLAREVLLHTRLQEHLRRESLVAEAWSQTIESESVRPSHATRPESIRTKSTQTVTRSRRWFTVGGGIAACLAAVMALAYAISPRSVVAQVTRVTGAAVDSAGAKVEVGDLLARGEKLRIDRGAVLLTFECGAQVLVEAPAVFVTSGPAMGTLNRGVASSRVPARAVGFAIGTTVGKVTDLGTEFRLSILDEDRLELHVFDGLVEVDLDRRFHRSNAAPLQISEGRSALFDASTSQILTLAFDKSLRPDF